MLTYFQMPVLCFEHYDASLRSWSFSLRDGQGRVLAHKRTKNPFEAKDIRALFKSMEMQYK